MPAFLRGRIKIWGYSIENGEAHEEKTRSKIAKDGKEEIERSATRTTRR